MQTGAITSYIDVAQLTLYAFWLFFAGLVYYLLRENKREGYPMVRADRGDPTRPEGFPFVPPPKTFLMQDGSVVVVPREEPRENLQAVPAAKFPGAPLVPTGNPMLAAVGPGAYAMRADVPDHTFDDGLPKIVPLRAATAFFLATEDTDPTGFTVVGSDGIEAGTVVDSWIDRSEVVIRYLEVQLGLRGAEHRVLLPMNFMQIQSKLRRVRCDFIRGSQFANVPTLKHPETVTLLEEDKIMAFYAGGMMYRVPGAAEPLL